MIEKINATYSMSLADGMVRIKYEECPDLLISYLEDFRDSETSRLYIISDENFSKISHEMTFKCLYPSFSSDEKLSTIKSLGDREDLLTPDFISINHEDKHVDVVELKTTINSRTTDFKILDAKLKYEEPIKRRCESIGYTYKLKVFVISSDRVSKDVITSFPKQKVKDSMLVYKHTLDLKALAFSLGWMFESDSMEEENLKDMHDSLRSMTIPLKSSDACVITKTSLDNWMKKDSKDCIRKSFMKLDLLFHEKMRAREMTLDEQIDRTASRAKNYFHDHDSHTISTLEFSDKAPIQIPFFLASINDKKSHEKKQSFSNLRISAVCSLSRLWNKVLSEESEWRPFEMNKEDLIKNAEMNLSSSDKITKLKRFRVKPSLTKIDRENLMQSGIEPSKDYKESSQNKNQKMLSKQGFKLNSDVQDITDFVEGNHLNLLSGVDVEYEAVESLISKAEELSGEDFYSSPIVNDVKKFWTDFRTTKIGRALSIMSRIVEEVNLSRLQFCKKRSVHSQICKRV